MKVLNAILLSLVLVLAASASDISGTWSGILKINGTDGQMKDDTIHMIVKQDGGKLTGTAGPSASEQLPIEKGVVEGNKVTMEVPLPNGAFKFAVALEGDHLTGDVTMSAAGQIMNAKMDAPRGQQAGPTGLRRGMQGAPPSAMGGRPPPCVA